jgi:hypothetical protein
MIARTGRRETDEPGLTTGRDNIGARLPQHGVLHGIETAVATAGKCGIEMAPENPRLVHTLVSYGDNTSDNIHSVQGVQSVLHRRQERRCCTKHHSPVKRPPS